MVRLSRAGLRGGQGGEEHLRAQVTASGVVPVAILVVLVALLLLALGALGASPRMRRLAGALLVPVSGSWIAFNGPIEGPILVTFTPTHGLTVSDVLGVVGLVVGLAALWRGRRRSKVPSPP